VVNHSFNGNLCNGKRKVPIVPIATVKSIKHVARKKTQPVKPRKIHVCYPYIIFSSIKYRFREYPRKIEVQNMFKTKLVNSSATTPKLPKIDNVPINVVVFVTTCSQ
jgi:hypothetical protein